MDNYEKNKLKDSVYRYIKEHKYASPSEISIALKIANGIVVLEIIEELREKNFIVLKVFPLTESNDSSVRYVVTDKKYDYKS